MQAFGVPTGTLTKDEILELGRLALKAGYAVKIGERELKSGKKLKCIYYGDLKELETISNE